MADLPYIDRDMEVKIVGQDSTGLRVNYVSASATGSLQIAGEGVSGTPAGGVVSVQGVSGGTALPVSQTSGPWTINLTQVGGSAITLGQTTMSASIPITIASNQSALLVSQSGTWTTGRTWTLASGTDSVSVVQSTSPWITKDQSDGTNGTAVPSSTIQIGGSDGTDLRTLSTDTSGRMKLSGSSYFHPVYSAKVQSVPAVTTVLSTSLSATISATKAGNTIIVIAAVNAGTLTVTDSASQTYSTATSIAGNATQTFKIFYFPNTAANVTSVTISSTSSTDLNLIVLEYSGLLTASPLDQTSTHVQTAATTWTSNSTSATAQASELLIGGLMGTLHNNTVFTPDAGWNSIATVDNVRGGANLQLQMSDQIVSAIGTYAYTGTNASNDVYAAIATFKFVIPNMLVQANTAAIIKNGSGILRKLVLNTIGTGSASVTFYDNTTNSGTIIAITALIGQVISLEYNLVFNTGLTIVLNSTSPDLTIVYD